MKKWTEQILDLTGNSGLQGKLTQKTQEVENLEKTIRVLEAMTPQELASNSRKIFTPETLKLIAEKSETDGPFVDQVLVQHDMLRADRRWSRGCASRGRPVCSEMDRLRMCDSKSQQRAIDRLR